MNRRNAIKCIALTGTVTASGAAGSVLGRVFARPHAARPLACPGTTAEPASGPFFKDNERFGTRAAEIVQRHYAQTRETVDRLKRKYEQAVFGKMRIWDLVPKLAMCIDPTDRMLGCASQLVHVQQVVAGMEEDGITDPDLYVAALVHDLGKVLLLANEAPEHVVCGNHAIGEHTAGVGLDNVLFQWNHDEFMYSRIKDHVPAHLAWLVRYHSLQVERCMAFMNDADRAYFDSHFRTFRKYDFNTKSPYSLPTVDLEKYRDMVEQYFPNPILV